MSESWCITADEARHVTANEALERARALSRPAISGYRVGAAAVGVSGRVWLGANFEFPGSPTSFSIHAEQCAVMAAWRGGEERIVNIAVTAPPCGHCRQFLCEIDGGADIRVLVAGSAPGAMPTVGDLLPGNFGPRDLGFEAGFMAPGAPSPAAIPDGLGVAALAEAAAATSWAPYTGSRAAVAVETDDGRTLFGVYVENAAFNPVVHPVMDLAVEAVRRGVDLRSVRRCVLAAARDGRIDHVAQAAAMLLAVGVTPELKVAWVDTPTAPSPRP
jgi:cytidine deaminase